MTTATTTGMMDNNKCIYCGNWHTGQCPRVRAIDYYPDGSVKRVEFHESTYGNPVGTFGQARPPRPNANPGATHAD